MQPHQIGKTATSPYGKLFWAFIATLIVGQLAAVWMLCSQQVRTAQMRPAKPQVVRTAVADCLLYIRDASRDSCEKTREGSGAARSSISSAISSPTPVNFTFR